MSHSISERQTITLPEADHDIIDTNVGRTMHSRGGLPILEPDGSRSLSEDPENPKTPGNLKISSKTPCLFTDHHCHITHFLEGSKA